MTSVASFVTSLITSALIFLGLMIIYTILSRRSAFRVIYYPALLLGGRRLPDELHETWRPWSWAVDAIRAKNSDIIRIAGLDAAIYLLLFTSALKIIFFSGLYCLPVLLPLAITDKNIAIQNRDPATRTNSTKLDNLAMTNIQNKSSRIWAYLGGVYWVSFVTYWVLNRTYRYVIKLRADAQGAEKAHPEQFSCLVLDIPKPEEGLTREEQVDTFFREVHPDTYEKSLIVTKLQRPSKLWTKLETAKAKLAHAEAVYELSKTKTDPEGKRPTNRTGKFGLYGSKVDSIDYWNEKIKDLPPVLLDEQARTKTAEQQGAAVVFFNSRRAAAEAAQEKHAPVADKWVVLPAPEPRAVLWSNMHIGFYSRMIREYVVVVIVFLLVVFNMIPIAFIAGLTTLDNLTKYLPFVKPIIKITALRTVIQAYLPQLALIIFLALLPKLLLILSKLEGIVSKAHLERAACGKMYYFVVFNVFLGFTIFGTLFNSSDSINELRKAGAFSFNKIIDLFGSSLPPNATYYITFVALKFFVGYGLEISRLIPLVMYVLKKKFLVKTDAEDKAAWFPGPFSYLPNVPNDLLVITITLAYSVIAPLILPFAFAYYGIGWLVLRNQALKVYVPDYESGGRFWPHIHNRFLVGLFVSQITALGFFGIKKFKYVFILLPLPFLTLFFALVTRRIYYYSFKYVSIEAASQDVKEVPTLPSVVDAYTPTCLLERKATSEDDKADDSKYEDAESQLPSRTSSGVATPAEQQPHAPPPDIHGAVYNSGATINAVATS